jgi:hypothetical protein
MSTAGAASGAGIDTADEAVPAYLDAAMGNLDGYGLVLTAYPKPTPRISRRSARAHS